MPDRRLILTPRDERVLGRVFLHRVLTKNHLIAMGIFGSTPRANQRLRLLFDHGYLRRAFVAAGPHASKAVYLPGPASIDLLARNLEIPREEVARQARKEPGRIFLEHSLACADLRVVIEGAAKAGAYTVETYLPEPLCRHEYVVQRGGNDDRRVLKPDGYVSLACGDRRLNAFLEIDMGHVGSAQIARSFLHYASYLADGLFQESYGEGGFLVLVVTTAGPRRIANLARVAGSVKSPRIRFATADAVFSVGFGGRVWSSARIRDRARLFEEETP
ncbi:MAG: replication-relaxation family protein [Fimbriimonas sp.]